MKNHAMKSLTRIALMSSAGLIAISASIFVGPSAMAASPAESGNLQVADNQQPPPPPQKQKNNPPQGQQHSNQPQSQLHNNQPQGQHTQPKTYVPPKAYVQHQPKTYVQPKAYVPPKAYVQHQPKTYVQQQGQQYQGQQNQPKTYVPPKTNIQPQGQQYQGQQNQQGHRYDWSTYQPGHRPPQWLQYSQHFDPHPYQWNRSAERRYHAPAYRQPQGWHYQRWSYGQRFPTVYWSQNYWISDYWDYGLPDPPYGYVWVRYGPDAMLVAVETGIILSVMYGLFY